MSRIMRQCLDNPKNLPAKMSFRKGLLRLTSVVRRPPSPSPPPSPRTTSRAGAAARALAPRVNSAPTQPARTAWQWPARPRARAPVCTTLCACGPLAPHPGGVVHAGLRGVAAADAAIVARWDGKCIRGLCIFAPECPIIRVCCLKYVYY